MSDAPNGNAKWSTLAAWAGVILSLVFGIGAAVGGAFAIGLHYVYSRVEIAEAREWDRHYAWGRLEERIDQHGVRLVGLDVALQREMRDLDAAMLARIDDLDRRLQQEIATSQAANIDRAEMIRRTMDEMRMYQRETAPLNAEQSSRIEAIERVVYGGGGR